MITDVTVRVRRGPQSPGTRGGWPPISSRRGGRARAGPVRPPARRDPALGRGGDPRLARPLEHVRPQALAARLVPAPAPPRGRVFGDRRLGGRRPRDVERRRALLVAGPAICGRRPARGAPGRAWSHGRFAGPYLRDELLDLGYFVETLETSHTWSRYQELYAAVGDALRGAPGAGHARPGLVSPLARLPGRRLPLLHVRGPRKVGAEIEQWRAVKTAACEAIVATGGTITHHHAVVATMRRTCRRRLGTWGWMLCER